MSRLFRWSPKGVWFWADWMASAWIPASGWQRWQRHCKQIKEHVQEFQLTKALPTNRGKHYCSVIMGAMASQITSVIIVYLTVYSGADQRKHQSSASLAFARGFHRWPVNSPHKWPVTRKMFPFDDVIMHRLHSSSKIVVCFTSGSLKTWLVIMITFSSLATPQFVAMRTCGATTLRHDDPLCNCPYNVSYKIWLRYEV